MPPANFIQFQQEFFQLYGAGKYTDADMLIQLMGGLYPEQAGTIYNWRICLASLQGQNDKALKLLQEALDLGLWWTEATLREDADLAALQGQPEFERMLSISKERYQTAMRESQAEMLLYLPGDSASKPYPTLIVFHGRMGNALETGSYWQALADQGWLVAAAQSSQLQGHNLFVWDDLELAVRQVKELTNALFKQHPVDLQRVLLGGFSQGGGLAIYLAINGVLPSCGFIGVAPFIASLEAISLSGKAPSPAPVRGYLVTGGKDRGQDGFQQIRLLLNKIDVPCQVENHPELGHAYPDRFSETILRALHFILQTHA